MIRGTTPVLKFGVPFKTSLIAVLNISFAQAGTIVLEKTLESVQLEDKSIRVQLSQAETLLFADSSLVEIQIRVRLTDGNALASDIISTSCERILKDGTI